MYLGGFPDSSVCKEYTCNVGSLGYIPGLGRSPEERKDYPLQYSGLENSMYYMVHGVAKSQTQLSGFYFHVPWLKLLLIMAFRDFPSGPVVKTLHSQCRGPRFNPWVRELDLPCMQQLRSLHAAIKIQHSQNKETLV